MKFVVITPSFNQLSYLKRCIASVRDQVPESWAHGAERIEVHHHVQDGGSTDGTVEFLRECEAGCRRSGSKNEEQSAVSESTARIRANYYFSLSSERDSGMYDALNRGIESLTNPAPHILSREREDEPAAESPRRVHCEEVIVSWLNCDEQYLPETLAVVADYFKQHAAVDVLCGDVLLVNEAGGLIAYRKTIAPRRSYIEASHLYTLSCATFFRQRLFEQVGQFDVSFRAAADEDLMLRALRCGMQAGHMKRYLSLFTFSGENLSVGQLADREHRELKRRSPWWVRMFRPVINAARRTEKWISGAYRQQFPLTYEIYLNDLSHRDSIKAEAGTYKWPE